MRSKLIGAQRVRRGTYEELRFLRRTRFALEAHKDEQAVLTRQAVGSIPTGRTKFAAVAEW